MKSERLYSAIGAADDELLIRLEGTKNEKNISWLKWSALAACFCFVIIGALMVKSIYYTEQYPPAEGRVISSYEIPGASSAGSYVVPECGTWYYFVDVSAAIEKYAGQEVTYLLAFDIFPKDEALINNSNEMKAELERLTGLGYEVGYIETWTYQGQGEQVYYYIAAGYFTAEQLENFPASSDYGYAFRFITNGDGSPVDAQQGLITDYSFGHGFDIQ